MSHCNNRNGVFVKINLVKIRAIAGKMANYAMRLYACNPLFEFYSSTEAVSCQIGMYKQVWNRGDCTALSWRVFEEVYFRKMFCEGLRTYSAMTEPRINNADLHGEHEPEQTPSSLEKVKPLVSILIDLASH